MNNMKVAALTGTLLARKGSAMPSAFAPVSMPPTRPPAIAPAKAPMPARREPPPKAACGPAVKPPKRDATGRIKFSLRLSPDLHLKLKLVAAFRRESAQRLLVAAMERYLDQVAPNAAREEYAWMAEMDDELSFWPVPAGHASFDLTG